MCEHRATAPIFFNSPPVRIFFPRTGNDSRCRYVWEFMCVCLFIRMCVADKTNCIDESNPENQQPAVAPECSELATRVACSLQCVLSHLSCPLMERLDRRKKDRETERRGG